MRCRTLPRGKKAKAKTGARKTKKTADQEKPTRPQSAYFFWLEDVGRDDLKRRFPNLPVTQLGKKAGEEWQALDNKTKWVRKYEKAMKNYQKRLAAYKENKAEAEAESGKPKRPQSAYFFWLQDGGRDDLKKRFPDLPVTQLGKKAGEEWNALEDKSEWVQMYEKALKAYQKRLTVYKESNPDEGTGATDASKKRKAKTPAGSKRRKAKAPASSKRRKAKAPASSKRRKAKAPASSKKRKAKAPASSKKRKAKAPASSKRRKAKAAPAGGKNKRKPERH